jgi:hypothetical protein
VEREQPRPPVQLADNAGVRIVGARARTENGQPLSHEIGQELLYEVDVINPTNSAATATVAQDYGVSITVSVPPNSTRSVPVGRAVGLLPCVEGQSWPVWLTQRPELRRNVRLVPGCTFGTPERPFAQMTIDQTQANKVFYKAVRVKSVPTTCNQPLSVEADIRNSTNSAASVSLYIQGFPPTTVTVAAGSTKANVSTGWPTYTGSSGPLGVKLVDSTNPSNPAVVQGNFVVPFFSKCKPTFSLAP